MSTSCFLQGRAGAVADDNDDDDDEKDEKREGSTAPSPSGEFSTSFPWPVRVYKRQSGQGAVLMGDGVKLDLCKSRSQYTRSPLSPDVAVL